MLLIFSGGFILAIIGNVFVMHRLGLKNDKGQNEFSNVERLPTYLVFIAGAYGYWFVHRNNPDATTQSRCTTALGCFATGGATMSIFRVAQDFIPMTSDADRASRFTL